VDNNYYQLRLFPEILSQLLSYAKNQLFRIGKLANIYSTNVLKNVKLNTFQNIKTWWKINSVLNY